MTNRNSSKSQLSVWLGDEFRAEVENWARQEHHASLSSAVKTLAQRGLSAVSLPEDLLLEIDRRRTEHGHGVLEMTLSRNQYTAGLLRAALGKSAGAQGALDFGRPERS